MIKNFALAAVAAATLAACATSTPYGPATGNNPYGFSEQRIEANRYRIVFRGNSSTTREAVETYLLFRAAELTVQNGFDHFVLTEQDTEANKRYSTSASPAFFGRYSYGYGPYCCAFPYYAYGWGWGSPYDYDAREITRYTAIAFVVMNNGPKPADNPQAFDARDVLDNLRSFVVASPEN